MQYCITVCQVMVILWLGAFNLGFAQPQIKQFKQFATSLSFENLQPNQSEQ